MALRCFVAPDARRFVVNLGLAFLPAAILGFFLIKSIKAHLFHPLPVAVALVVGGFLILWAERRQHTITVNEVDDMTPLVAIKIGLAQCLALIPGTSRSGATIIGGLLFGLSRKAATEFSFFLAIPTMFAATLYDVYKHRELFDAADLPVFAVADTLRVAPRFYGVRLVPHRVWRRAPRVDAGRVGDLGQLSLASTGNSCGVR